MKSPKHVETELYEPIKAMLLAQGFVVRGEVKDCDIAAVKDEELWVVEMKLQLNMTLLYQAMERLKITNQVFVAIPRPKRVNDKQFVLGRRILQKLELGLITVSLDSPAPVAEIILFPGGKPVKANKANASVKREIAGRTVDSAGGVTKVKINTAYRERCIRIACLLEQNESLSAAALVNRFGCEKDASGILRTNHYGWFKKVGRGLFALTEEGLRYLTENESSGVVAYYRIRAIESIHME